MAQVKNALPPMKEGGFFATVEEFVTYSGGDHAIQKILIANNGIGATKAIRSIRRWSFETFGNERMIQFVAMATPEDMRANAEYIRLADQVVDVPGGSNNNNYANINLICQIADHYKVDAVMPMWGHASENPALPTSLLKMKHRVSFIGPPAEPMQALGDKIGSTIIAQSADVPTIAWNGDGIKVDYRALGGIPQEVYDQANVTTAENALACCERIGYPVMIKASEGGGGKGIRKVLRAEDVQTLYRQVASEIPGSPIFVMKMASKARHLEVQLLADKHGDAIALSGRDCSVQRRHQKIIEEGPPIAAPLSVFRKMEKAAISLAKTVGYCNCGTVEYLYLEETQEFAFLELNPRLQVEHPVTENILGLNLPACQLQVAMGIPLYRMGDIRKMYGRHPMGQDTIDFEYAEKATPPRHCIAVRITAENPEASFQPTSGNIQELQFLSAIDVWGYFSVNSSGLIHEFADSQFGHIFASGADRESARRAMIVALKELQIRGDIRTTVEYIIKMLQSSDFIHNKINTDWLDGRIARHKEITAAERRRFCPPATLVATCGAALQGFKQLMNRDESFINMLKMGQVPPKDILSPVVKIDLIFDNIKYRTSCIQSGGENVIVVCNDEPQRVSVRPLSDGGYLLNVSGKSHVAYFTEETAGTVRMILDGHTCMFTPEYDPTKLTSSVAGKLARLLVQDGSHVDAGEPFVEIEVMKMYMPLKALEAGTVSFQMSQGATLSPGDVIATVQLDNPDAVVTAEEFKGSLCLHEENRGGGLWDSCDEGDGSLNVGGGSLNSHASAATLSVLLFEKETDGVAPHIKQRDALKSLQQVLEGYPLSEKDISANMATFISTFRDPLTPVLKVEAALSVLRGRIDADLTATIHQLNDQYRAAVAAQQARKRTASAQGNSLSSLSSPSLEIKYPATQILLAIQACAQSVPLVSRSAFLTQTAELWAVVEPYLFSTEEIILSALSQLLESYLSVEKLFDNMSFTDMVNQLRKDYINDLHKVLLLCRSHVNLKAKNHVVLAIIDEIKAIPNHASIKRPDIPLSIGVRNELHTRKIKVCMTELAKLREQTYSHISFSANLMLIDQLTLTVETRAQRLDEAVVAALTTGDGVGQGDRAAKMHQFVTSNLVFRDILINSLFHDPDYQIAVIEIYLRKIYLKTHNLQNLGAGTITDDLTGTRNCWVSFEFMTNSVEVKADAGVTSRPDGAIRSSSFSDLAVHQSLASADSNGNLAGGGGAGGGAGSSSLTTHVAGSRPVVRGLRHGVFAVIATVDHLASLFSKIIAKIPEQSPVTAAASTTTPAGSPQKPIPKNAVHVLILSSSDGAAQSDDQISSQLCEFLSSFTAELNRRSVRRVSFFLGRTKGGKPSMPLIITYRNKIQSIQEDRLFRHIEAPHAYHLDLPKLAKFQISLEDGHQTASGNVHLYRAVPLEGKGARRFFARLVSFTADVQSNDVESLYVEALDHMALVLGKEDAATQQKASSTNTSRPAANHIFINVVSPDTVVQADYYETLLRKMCSKYSHKMVRLGITTVELKLTCRLSVDSEPTFLRLVASNPTGFVLVIDKYYEAVVNGQTVYRCINRSHAGPLDGKLTSDPYEVSQTFENERAAAMSASETLYVYDWPLLFEHAAEKAWIDYYASHAGQGGQGGTVTRLSSGTATPGRGLNPRESGTPGITNTLALQHPTSPSLLLSSPGTSVSSMSTVGGSSALQSPTFDASMLYAAPTNFFSCTELVLCDPETQRPLPRTWSAKETESAEGAVLLPVRRAAGNNDVGMVAWLIRMTSPECPDGREFVVICNDITFQAGSFGTREDVVFFKASEYARVRGIPRLFLAANSGARIGMADSLRSKFNVCFQDPADPSKGFKYIYMDKPTFDQMLHKVQGDKEKLPILYTEVPAEESPTNEVIYRIDDIIGEEPDLGVENLMGSGLIAGETSRAYNEIFTLTLVVGRTVGIGAYLVRLGQRTIQKTRNAPIILTGYQALNKLMGREIYTTNDQLGGPMIMFPNGVSHQLADTHLDAVVKALEWLSFVPAVRGGALPVRGGGRLLTNGTAPSAGAGSADSVDRTVDFAPMKGVTYDPRLLFNGLQTGPNAWQSGFFDRGSFVESLGGWAKTVVVGRGRLGGIPLGVIVTENRTAEATKPADPADVTSQEKLVQQAGGVWFPDSAYKTAQALKDFNREGLACIIFANWRGFSGGQRDMFDEVLKFGSMIVDALVAYQQPLFVYIPPFAELRGGAWVVVDSTINADVMEFYAAEDARGGVLEATGAAAIKFRDRDIIATSHRLDPTLRALDEQLAQVRADQDKEAESRLYKQITHRESMLFGVYQQIAVHFADLHDTPGRMQAKGVIRRQVNWAESRRYFYWRLRRRLAEFSVVNAAHGWDTTVAGSGERRRAIQDLRQWFLASPQAGENAAASWENDSFMVDWLLRNAGEVDKYLSSVRTERCAAAIHKQLVTAAGQVASPQSIGDGNASDAMAAVLLKVLAQLPEDERKQVLAKLK